MFDSFKVFSEISPMVFKPHNAFNISAVGLLTAGAAGLNVLSPYVLGETIQLIAANTTFNIFGFSITPLEMAAAYSTTLALAKVFPVLRKLSINPIVSSSAYEMFYKCMVHFDKLSHRYSIETKLGDKSELAMKAILSTTDYTSQLLTQVIPTLLEASVAGSILTVWYGWPIIVGLGSIITASVTYNSLNAKRISTIQSELIKKRFQVSRNMLSVLTNYETIHMFNNSPHELAKFKQDLKPLIQAATRSSSIPDEISLGQLAIIGIGFGAMSFWAAWKVLRNDYGVSDFIFITYYLAQFSIPLNSFGEGISKIRAATTDLETVINFLHTVPEVRDLYPNNVLRVTQESADIVFDNVVFNYNEDVPVLKGVSFQIPAGKKTGIVGMSGAGKSTLGRLLFRFYDVDDGSIKINNQDIREISLQSLRSAISIVPQNPVLFNDTLGYNIWYGGISIRGETINKDLVLEAVKAGKLENLVHQNTVDNKDGLDVQMGERGQKISGGQLQRVAIARAILKDPAILLFDEATTGLDAKTETEIQQNLDEISEGVTTMVITHNLANVKNAHKIIVLQDGMKVDEGTHEDLIKRGGVYASMWKEQTTKFQNNPVAEQGTIVGKSEEDTNQALELIKEINDLMSVCEIEHLTENSIRIGFQNESNAKEFKKLLFAVGFENPGLTGTSRKIEIKTTEKGDYYTVLLTKVELEALKSQSIVKLPEAPPVIDLTLIPTPLTRKEEPRETYTQPKFSKLRSRFFKPPEEELQENKIYIDSDKTKYGTLDLPRKGKKQKNSQKKGLLDKHKDVEVKGAINP